MLPNKNLSKDDAQWLIKEIKPLLGGSIRGKNISIYTKAVNLIRGTNLPNPGCSCEYKTKALTAQSLFGQYHEDIEKIANA